VLPSLRVVPPGTEGGVSAAGTLAGLLGALLVAGVGAGAGLHSAASAGVVTGAGLLGCLAESLAGPCAKERGYLGDHLLNAANTAAGALSAVLLARAAAGLGPPLP
jgi:uncharacterized membrane protein